MNDIARRILMDRARRRKEHRADAQGEQNYTVRASIVDAEPVKMQDVNITDGEMQAWAQRLLNADGSRGARFTRREIEHAADALGVKNADYSMDDLWMAANMAYSDYCGALLDVCPSNRDGEATLYTRIGAAFLDDADASARGEEKLMLYYRCIVDG